MLIILNVPMDQLCTEPCGSVTYSRNHSSSPKVDVFFTDGSVRTLAGVFDIISTLSLVQLLLSFLSWTTITSQHQYFTNFSTLPSICLVTRSTIFRTLLHTFSDSYRHALLSLLSSIPLLHLRINPSN